MALALELGQHVGWAIGIPEVRRATTQAEFWERIGSEVRTQNPDAFLSLSQSHFSLCTDGVREGVIPLADLIQWHGITGLFLEVTFQLFPNTRMPSIASHLLFNVFAERRNGTPGRSRTSLGSGQLGELGRMLSKAPIPWVKKQVYNSGIFNAFWMLEHAFESDTNREPNQGHIPTYEALDGDISFGAFALLAVMMEATSKEEVHPPFASIMRSITNHGQVRECLYFASLADPYL
jgi:hypothetical protein